MRNSITLSEEALCKLLSDTDIPVPKVYPSVTSTNILAKEAARKGAPAWSCTAATHQSAGRGRLGRSFYSPEGSGIYFSVILRPLLCREQLTMLTTSAAVAVCMAIEEEFKIFPEIKWVNDVYLDSKKICGILTEAAFDTSGNIDFAVTGVGINLLAPENGFPHDISGVAGSVLPSPAENADNRILASFLKHYKRICLTLDGGSTFAADEYRRRCFVIGKEINMISSGEIIGSGVALDTDPSCRLIVERSDGSREILSFGEISVKIKE